MHTRYADLFEPGGGEEQPVSNADKLAALMCGVDKTQFQSAKRMDLEDVYKQLWIMNEEIEKKNAAKE